MPEETTQMGISIGIGINYSHVPRAVKRLQKEGFISELTAHTSTKPAARRRKSYYLTNEGIKIAEQLFNGLKNFEVKIKNQKGEYNKLSLEKLKEQLKTNENLVKLYQFLSTDSLFDLPSWEYHIKSTKIKGINKIEIDPKTSHISKTTLEKNHMISKIETNSEDKNEIEIFNKIFFDMAKQNLIYNYDFFLESPKFFNRQSELDTINRFIQSEDQKLLIISGPRGIGKNSLIAQLIKQVSLSNNNGMDNNIDLNDMSILTSKRLPYLWLSNPKNQSMNDFLNKILNIIEVINYRNKLNDFHKNLENGFTQRLARLFKQFILMAPNDISLLIFSDIILIESNISTEVTQTMNLMDIHDEISEFEHHNPFIFLVHDLMQNQFREHNLKIIITTKEDLDISIIEKYFTFSDIKKEITILKLSGLDFEHTKQILDIDFQPEFIKAIHNLTEGNPLLIKTIKRIEHSKLTELKSLRIEDGCLALVLIAQKMLQEE